MKQVRERVAIIGAGPAGLVAARYLAAHGFDPVIFETARRLGGQWNEANEASGIWPGMLALSGRANTRFSDLDYPETVGQHPAAAEVRAYLEAYAEAFGLARTIQFETVVETLARHSGGGWTVSTRSAGRPSRTELFAKVVVANGRNAAAHAPDLPGLARFGGEVLHSGEYPGGARFGRRSVVVLGGGASGTEIAVDLAEAGAQVTLSAAALHPPAVALSRFETLGGRASPAEASGEPRLAALVAQGLIALRPEVRSIGAREVVFSDGSRLAPDAIVLATGYRPALDFLDPESRETLFAGRGDGRLGLCRHTFHPDLPGLAFLGLVDVSGPAFPALENQARWIAYGWAGLAALPSAAEMRAAVSVEPEPRAATELALEFARLAGIEPDPTHWPMPVREVIMFGPLSPLSFRLSGPDALPDAARILAEEAVRAAGGDLATDVTVLTPRVEPVRPDGGESRASRAEAA